jgi:cytochrome c
MALMELSKAAAAVIAAGIAFAISGVVGQALVHSEMPARTAIPIPSPDPPVAAARVPAAAPSAPAPQVAAAAASAAPPAAGELKARLASADPANGEAISKRMCAICHTFNQGGRAGVGPNLWAVVGAPHGHMAGFNYTAGLKGHPGPWTYADLDDWLRAPAAYAPGTRMAFAGLADPQQRADVIVWLRSLAETPAPLP